MVGRLPVQMVSLNALKIGDTIIRSQTVGRMDQGAGTKFEHIDFVLGMDVLSKQRFTLDFEHSVLVLWPAAIKLPAPSARTERAQLALVHPSGSSPLRPYISATLNQKNSATFLLDTGADAPMFVAFKRPAEMGFATNGASGQARVYEGANKLELAVSETIFSTLEAAAIGTPNKIVFTNVDGRVIDASTVNSPVTRQNIAFLNVIGTPFLKTLPAIHFDVAGRTVSIDREKSTAMSTATPK